MVNQLWFIASAALGEGFALGLRHGDDLGVPWSAVRQSVGDSFVARHDTPSIFAGHYDPSFTLDLCGTGSPPGFVRFKRFWLSFRAAATVSDG